MLTVFFNMLISYHSRKSKVRAMVSSRTQTGFIKRLSCSLTCHYFLQKLKICMTLESPTLISKHHHFTFISLFPEDSGFWCYASGDNTLWFTPALFSCEYLNWTQRGSVIWGTWIVLGHQEKWIWLGLPSQCGLLLGKKTNFQWPGSQEGEWKRIVLSTYCGPKEDVDYMLGKPKQKCVLETAASEGRARVWWETKGSPITLGSILEQSKKKDWENYCTAQNYLFSIGMQDWVPVCCNC